MHLYEFYRYDERLRRSHYVIHETIKLHEQVENLSLHPNSQVP